MSSACRYEPYKLELEDAKALREYAKDEIQTLASYTTILKQADFAYGRFDYYSRKGHKRGTARMQSKATRLYERAYEHLEELLVLAPPVRVLKGGCGGSGVYNAANTKRACVLYGVARKE